MEATGAVSGVDKELFCVLLGCATADEVYITLDMTHSLRWNQMEEWEYYGLVSFSSTISTIEILG